MRSFRFLLLLLLPLPLSVELTMLLTVLFFAFAPPKSMLHNLCALSLSILANNIFHMLSCTPSCLLPATCASPSDDVTGHAISMCSTEHTLALSLSHCLLLSLWHAHKLLRSHSQTGDLPACKNIYISHPCTMHVSIAMSSPQYGEGWGGGNFASFSICSFNHFNFFAFSLSPTWLCFKCENHVRHRDAVAAATGY